MKITEQLTLQNDDCKGCYYQSSKSSDRCILVLVGDEGNDFMDKAFASWLTKKVGVHALCVAIHQRKEDDTGVHEWPLEYIESAVKWLKAKGIFKIGILGMSIPGCLSLTAASLIPDISLVVAFTPCDFVPWGFIQGPIGKSSKGEWPSGTSAFTWRGKPLDYQSAFLEKENYWKMFCDDKKKYHEMHTITIFDHSENTCPIPESCFIPVENICGKIIFIGTGDDSMWNTSRYIKRMEKRLEEKQFSYPVKTFLYTFGTHLLVPESLLKNAIPVFGDLLYLMFISGRKHPDICKKNRIDLEKKLMIELQNWQ